MFSGGQRDFFLVFISNYRIPLYQGKVLNGPRDMKNTKNSLIRTESSNHSRDWQVGKALKNHLMLFYHNALQNGTFL